MANKSQQQAAPIPAASPLPATGTLRGKNKMTPSARKHLAAAARARWAKQRAAAGGGTITVTAAIRGNPMEPLFAAAAGSWSPTQIATALEQARRNVMSAQRLVGWLEDLQREQQPEHAMGAGGGSMGG
jgi:hypothetical protein